MYKKDKSADKKPPRPKLRAAIYQYWQTWDELVNIRKHHTLRKKAILRGDSNMDVNIEDQIFEDLKLNSKINLYKRNMISSAEMLAPDIFYWLTSIWGIGPSSAAQLIAQIDDIGRFDNISKLWRYSGLGVVNGEAERNVPGKTASMNKKFKSFILGVMASNFIKCQTPLYIDIYYAEKARQREIHPDVLTWETTENGRKVTHYKYNDGHLDNMAKRKMIKLFLSHVWLVWRQSEGLPVSDPYPIAILGHSGMITPDDVINVQPSERIDEDLLEEINDNE